MNDSAVDDDSDVRRSKGSPTLRDVARVAGVSISTASRALSGNPQIGNETRQRVQQAADELHYVVNGLIHSLRGSGPRTLAFITKDFLAEPFARMAQGAEGVAQSQQSFLLMNSYHGNIDNERAFVTLAAQQRAAGVLLVGSRTASDEYCRQVREYDGILSSVGAHLVLCGCTGEPLVQGVPSISYDQRGGMRSATQALLQAGHRRIAFLGFAQDTLARERFAGYQDAMAAAGIRVDADDEMVQHAANIEPDTSKAAEYLLDLDVDHRPTAMVCVTDVAAYCVYRLAERRGLRLPDELSIVGFDDLSTDTVVSPKLSSVSVPFEQIGSYGAQLALGGMPWNGQHRILPTMFVQRDSICSPSR